nr:pantoate--beta-alanine ligase [Rubripirellula obstinata]
METIQTCDKIRDLVLKLRGQGQTVGLVPTMGALHDGHLSLVHQSLAQCDHTVVSIFVNPTQFGPSEDLAKYPRTLDRDLQLLEDASQLKHSSSNGDVRKPIAFVPANDEMYPAGYSTTVDPPSIAMPLEGEFRPGHFRGVATVVLKLFAAAPANVAFFGRKDFQQFKVIQRMTRDLNLGVELRACDTVREPDGLALSSRNRYLSPSDRTRALSLSKALSACEDLINKGIRDVDHLTQAMHRELANLDKIDYAVVVNSETLLPIDKIQGSVVALIAAHVGGTRLIDNRVFS